MYSSGYTEIASHKGKVFKVPNITRLLLLISYVYDYLQ